jgi:hypothetical protein
MAEETKEDADSVYAAPGKGSADKEDIQKAVEAIYAYAGALLREGKSPSEVEDALVEKGIERKTAAIVVTKLVTARKDAAVHMSSAVADANKEAGTRNMLIGGLICAVGLIVTIATYSAASSGGGQYVVAWGAIIFGAIRFFRGLGQMSG